MIRILLIFMLIALQGHSQDCTKTFWTVNGLGEIKQWALGTNEVTGGETVVTTSGFNPSGLSYNGSGNQVTFYCATSSSGVVRYDSQDGWVTVLPTVTTINNGGYGAYQYFLVGSTLKFFDGETLSTVASVPGMGVADIAVDSQGQAWVFVGGGVPIVTTQLRVYNTTGLVATYPFLSATAGAFGSFFLDDILYIVKAEGPGVSDPNSMIPIYVNGTQVTQGTPIPFSCPGCHDAAGCNVDQLRTNDFTTEKIEVSPNPTTGKIDFNTDDIERISVFSIDGKLVKIINGSGQADISELEDGIYMLTIENADHDSYTTRIVKRN